MGKKTKRIRNKVETECNGCCSRSCEVMTRETRKDTMELVKELLEKCSRPLGVGNQEWTDFLDIYQLLQQIQSVQKENILKPLDREKKFDSFLGWLSENGVNTSNVDVAKFEEGYGLQATKDIEVAELILEIPRQLMMTTETAYDSCLRDMIEEDRILQAMPNIVMALHVLCERMTPDSKWKHYLNILPDSYTTPLYFTSEELELLKGSPAQSDMLNQFRNIARQYAYFFKLFHTSSHAGKLPIKDFCYEDYRWAVSTVMTRQNQIPSSHGDTAITALIPLWDMCNHCTGQLSTDFNIEKDASQCFAFRPFGKDQQIYIFYGSRSNAELLIHNGFIYSHSKCDRMSLKLGVSKNDPLFDKKAKLLARMNLLSSRSFFLHYNDDPIESELLAFLRVFNLDEEQLDERLTGDNAKELQRNLRDFMDIVNEENETKSWNFLATRLSLLLRTYENIEEVKEDTPICKALAIQLRVAERRILTKVKAYSELRIEKVRLKQSLAPTTGEAPPEPLSITNLDEIDEHETKKEPITTNVKAIESKAAKSNEESQKEESTIDDMLDELEGIEVAN